MSRYNPCAFSVKTPPVASTISILKPCLLRRQQTILRRVDGVHAVGTIPHSFRIPSYTTMALFKRKIHSTLKKINSIDSIYFDRSVPRSILARWAQVHNTASARKRFPLLAYSPFQGGCSCHLCHEKALTSAKS